MKNPPFPFTGGGLVKLLETAFGATEFGLCLNHSRIGEHLTSAAVIEFWSAGILESGGLESREGGFGGKEKGRRRKVEGDLYGSE